MQISQLAGAREHAELYCVEEILKFILVRSTQDSAPFGRSSPDKNGDRDCGRLT